MSQKITNQLYGSRLKNSLVTARLTQTFHALNACAIPLSDHFVTKQKEELGIIVVG